MNMYLYGPYLGRVVVHCLGLSLRTRRLRRLKRSELQIICCRALQKLLDPLNLRTYDLASFLSPRQKTTYGDLCKLHVL